jgi:hypothetical protein
MDSLLKKTFEAIPSIEPYGGMKLSSGKLAKGTSGPVEAKSSEAPKGE